MKKLLLSGALLIGSYFAANAQASCDAAVEITANGTQASGTVTGTYAANCWGGTGYFANWYKYTPTANGMLFITSDLVSNPATTDTRLSVFTGTCSALTCYNGNDDIDAGTPGNYRSSLNIPVQSGVTYYIAWDSRWSAAAFSFDVTFTASDCLSPNGLSINDATNITTTSATVSWEAGIGNPAGYDVEWGAVDFTQGSGTTVSTTTTSASLTGLPASSTVWYYVRANCGATQGQWEGPYEIKLAVTAPYSNNFDTAGNNADGFVVSGWNLSTAANQAAFAQSGTAFIFANISATPTANYAFFRPLSVTANEVVTISFYSLLAPATATANLEVSVGASTDVASQTTIVQTIPLTGAALAATNYTQQTVTWTAPAAGVYYFALHAVDATATGSLLVDTVSISSVLSTNENIASQVSVYPNPATNVVNVVNNNNILVNGIQITDLNGRTVKSAKFAGVAEAQVNISDLANGIYMMTVSSDKGSMTQKIVKN